MKKLIKKNGKKGFTLVELIVVIAIVAILAAIAIPTFNGIVKNSRQKAADADAKTIASEVSMYISKYEAGESVGTPATKNSVTATGTDFADKAFAKSGVTLASGETCAITIGGDDTDGFTLTKVELKRNNGITGTFPKS